MIARLAVLFILAAALSQQPTPTAVVEGRILDSVRRTPISGVVVQVRERPQLQAVSDQNGTFRLPNINAGLVNLCASKPGYMAFGLGHSNDSGRLPCIPLNIPPGMKSDVIIDAMAEARLEGRVHASTGEPVVGVSIVAFRYSFNERGEWAPQDLGGTRFERTDDLGEFTIAGLRPGRYGLRAIHTRLKLGEVHAALHFPVTYYRSGTRIDLADTIEVQAGTHLSVGGIVLAPASGGNLRISIVNQTEQTPTQGFRISLRSADSSDVLVSGTLPVGVSDTVLGELPFGSYFLQVDFQARQGSYRGTSLVEVAQQNSNVNVVVSRQARVRARVLPNSPDLAIPPSVMTALQLRLAPSFKFLSARVTTVGAANLSISGLEPGRYRATVVGNGSSLDREPPLPGDLYLLELHGKGRNLLIDQLDLEPGEDVEITAVVGIGSALVEGTVLDSGGTALPGAVVVFLPEDRRQAHLVRSATTNSDGGFALLAAPGRYHAYAWTHLEGAAYRNSQFMASHNESGRPVVLDQNSRQELRLIARQP